MKRAIVVLLIIAAIGAGAGAYYYRRSGPEITVNTAAVSRGDVIDSVGSTGTVQAVTTVQVGSQVSGNVLELYADFNSTVRKGQKVAMIDPAPFQTKLDQAKANLDSSKQGIVSAEVALTKADYDISKFSKENQIILKGLKKYGMMLSDNGGPWFIIGEPDKRWNDGDLNKLKAVKGEDFEAVDESDWQMHADSGRVDPVALR